MLIESVTLSDGLQLFFHLHWILFCFTLALAVPSQLTTLVPQLILRSCFLSLAQGSFTTPSLTLTWIPGPWLGKVSVCISLGHLFRKLALALSESLQLAVSQLTFRISTAALLELGPWLGIAPFIIPCLPTGP